MSWTPQRISGHFRDDISYNQKLHKKPKNVKGCNTGD